MTAIRISKITKDRLDNSNIFLKKMTYDKMINFLLDTIEKEKQ